MVTVLFTGGRKCDTRAEIYHALNVVHAKHGIKLLVHGGATGADEVSGDWCELNGVRCSVEKAEWGSFQSNPGRVRNTHMLDRWSPDMVVAARGGSGTANMILQASRRGVTVLRTWRDFNND